MATYKQIMAKLTAINTRLATLERYTKGGIHSINKRLDDLLKLVPIEEGTIISSEEQRTINALQFNEDRDNVWNTASEVSILTGRKRPVESSHLNSLARNGIVERKPVGRAIHFRLRKKE